MQGLDEIQHRDDAFKKMIVASLGLHFFVILFFTTRAIFFPEKIPLYQPAIRVDLVGLPEKRKPEAPIAPKAQEKKAVPPPKSEPAQKTIKKEESLAINKLKTLSALEKLKNMKETPKEEPAAKKQADVIRGNKLADGASLKGLDKIDFNEYIGSLDTQVKNHWSLPEWMSALNLHAVVLVKIDKTGQIMEKTFTQKSGNSDFDARVMLAIDQANPFAPPPAKLVDLVSTQGIQFAFPE